MKKNILKKLGLWLSIVAIISLIVLHVLMNYNREVSIKATSELGNMYISEMMFQVQDHFQTILDVKGKEAHHISEHTHDTASLSHHKILCDTATSMDFDYLALLDSNNNIETLLGATAWYRNMDLFLSKIGSDDLSVTTGYLTETGSKYIVFGVPAQYTMSNHSISTTLLLGFSVDKLYQYINLDELKQMGSAAYVEIISSNGSYILKYNNTEETSYFDYIKDFGNFANSSQEDGISAIEKAMAKRENFSNTVTLSGITQHIYGSPAAMPTDWYFVISMPQAASDKIIANQYTSISYAYIISGLTLIILILFIFIQYLRLSIQQINEIEAARAEAETANKAKSVFLSNMSHDIRTPMNAIVGFTEIIESSLTSGNYTRATEYLTKMKRSSDYLRNLISDVLDMSKIESGMLTLTPEPTSLSRTIDTVATIANAHLSPDEHTFNVNVHDIIHDGILCDTTRLKQILINLLSNAIKFTPKGGTIHLEAWQESSSLGEHYVQNHFRICDTGIGMSDEFLKTMYESFSREDNKVRKIEGTGLGLTITKSLLDMMDGTISVESVEGKGTNFYISIHTSKVDLESIQKTIHGIPYDLKGMNILMAEDNDFNYDIAQVLLTENGFNIERAENGKAVVDKYISQPDNWDLILMDLRMPILNGYEATEQIREFEATRSNSPSIPILALSADVFAEDIDKCNQSGMNGHIAKPIDIHELLQTLHEFLSTN